MKKLYTFAAAFMLTATSFAQSWDLEATLTSPASGSSVAPGVVNVDFSFTNNGPDDVMTGDTVYFGYSVNGTAIYSMDGTSGSVDGIVLPVDWTSGMSLTATQLGGPFDWDLSANADGDNVCIVMLGVGSVVLAAADPFEADVTNNADCFTISTAQTGIEETALVASVYPNPATDVLNVKANEAVKSITIVGLDGQVVATSVNANEVNVSNLTSGLYIYNVETVSGKVATAKFMKK